jgi:hypothetical protein
MFISVYSWAPAIRSVLAQERMNMPPSVIKAVITDVQFWVPVVVLIFGLALLAWLH